MSALPSLAALRPALVRTGPYVDVLEDDRACLISQEEFDAGHSMTLRGAHLLRGPASRLRQADAYRSHVGCDKAWQLIVMDKSGKPIREEPYYDTIQLGMALIGGLETSPLSRRPIELVDAQMCIAKAQELVAKQGWASLAAYKEATYPSSAVPEPVPVWHGAERGRGAAFESFVGEFMSTGQRLYDKLILETRNGWHYGNLVRKLSVDQRGVLLPPDAALLNELQRGLAMIGFEFSNAPYEANKLASVLWGAYEEYKTALDISAWHERRDQNGQLLLRSAGQNWTRYWEYFEDPDLAERIMEVRHADEVPTLEELRGFAQVAMSKLRSFPHNKPGYPIADLQAAHGFGWTPETLLARATLTLWVATLISPALRPESRLSIIETMPYQYATDAVMDSSVRIPPPPRGAEDVPMRG